MKVLDKYIIRELIKSFFACLGFFTSLLLVVRFSEKEMGTFISRGMGLYKSLVSLALQTPGYIIQMTPPSMLFATFFSLGRMAQKNEITAMRSSGISLYRIFLTVLVSAFFIALFMIAFNDQVVTWATGKDIDLKSSEQHKPETASDVVFLASGNKSFYIKFISLREHEMRNITIYTFDEGNNVISSEFAHEASWSGETWHLKNVIERLLENGKWVEKSYAQKDITVSVDPQIIVKASQNLLRLPLNDLAKLIEYKKKTGQIVRKDLVAFHSRISFPFACFVMALLGAPLFTRLGRSGMAVGFLFTMFISFIYWGIAIAIFEALGNNGKLPPLISCWGANFLFISIGAVLVYKVRK